MTGNPSKSGPAKSNETVYDDFNRENSAFILDFIQAFGMASQQHNEDLREILERVLRLNSQH